MAEQLTKDNFDAAVAFVRTTGRPLDVALLNDALGVGSAEAGLLALSAFQNPDGGFGGGLEPDMQGPASAAIATSIALRLLVRLGASSRHPMVAGVLAWLAETIDAERGVWPIVTETVEEGPHAPWWTWSPDLPANWNGFRFNPTAEILAWLYAYADVAPAGLIAAAEAGMRQTLAETTLIEGAYDLKCAARLCEAPGVPADITAATIDLVRHSLAEHDPNDLHLPALEIALTPTSPFAAAIGPRLEPAVTAVIAAQQPDGGWTTFWEWSTVDAKAWAKAKQDWRGWLSREAIETLRAWGRVEAA
jgi:hypothetical protein